MRRRGALCRNLDSKIDEFAYDRQKPPRHRSKDNQNLNTLATTDKHLLEV